MKERLLEQPKQSKKESKKEMGGSNSGDLEEAKKEHFLQPFPRLRKPAEVVEAELDQLRMRLQKELREGRREARRRRQMRRRCRLQAGAAQGVFFFGVKRGSKCILNRHMPRFIHILYVCISCIYV